MSNWYMMTLVGEDQPGIVAKVTDTLFSLGLSLGEASMIRLGGNFSIMMMVRADDHLDAEAIDAGIGPVIDDLQLCMHLDPIQGQLHQHRVPNIGVRVTGADRAGIVAQVTGILAETGFNILELASDVAGSDDKPVYIMNIEGYCESSLEDLQTALDALDAQGVDVSVSAIETLIG